MGRQTVAHQRRHTPADDTINNPIALCRAIVWRKHRAGYPLANQDHADELIAELALEYARRAQKWDGRGNKTNYIVHYLNKEHPRLWAKTHPQLRIRVQHNRRTITLNDTPLPLHDTIPAPNHPLLAP